MRKLKDCPEIPAFFDETDRKKVRKTAKKQVKNRSIPKKGLFMRLSARFTNRFHVKIRELLMTISVL